MKEWKVIQLKEVCELIPGFAFKSSEFGEHDYSAVKIGDIQPPYVREEGLTGVDISRYSKEKLEKFKVYYGDFVLAMTGATIGKIGRYIGTSGAYINQRVLLFRPKENVNKEYLYYCLQTPVFQQYIFNHIDSQTAQPNISAGSVSGFEILLPGISVQNKIANILSALDSKIELNNRINHNLEEQAQALYKSWFVDFEPFRGGRFVDSELGLIPEGWSVQKAEELCEINIGKTPPRKEHQWFSNNNSDVTWISISDMGSSEVYISKSSEMLTKEACKKFNVIIVPEGTVLLSFKLTVGRVSIAAKELTTNEAIARFLVPTDAMRSYLYLALKSYDYSKLGSTSSIATAVNSKIIKKMALICPPEDIIEKFGVHVSGIFRSIKTLQEEISCLCEQRDSLLPHLMSGEIIC